MNNKKLITQDRLLPMYNTVFKQDGDHLYTGKLDKLHRIVRHKTFFGIHKLEEESIVKRTYIRRTSPGIFTRYSKLYTSLVKPSLSNKI